MWKPPLCTGSCLVRLLLGLLLLGLFLGSLSFAGQAEPIAVLRLDRGFIDDAFVLSPDGGTLYYVATDGATFAELRVASIRPPAIETRAVVPDLPLTVAGLYLLSEDRVLVAVQEDAGGKTGIVYSIARKAPTRQRIGPAGEIVLTMVSGQKAVLAISQGPSGEHRISAVSAATFRPLGARTFRLGGAEGQRSLHYFLDDYRTLAVKQEGGYDKKNDIRRPDQLAFLDTLTGKVQRTEPIVDPRRLAEQAALREQHPGESAFARYDIETGRLEVVDGKDADPRPIKMPRGAALYDPATLRYQRTSDGLLVSLTVDPVNEAAVARRKSDADTIDLCAVSLPGGEPRCLLALPGKARPSRWFATEGGRLALLRKHKGFSRGGSELEIYDLDLVLKR